VAAGDRLLIKIDGELSKMSPEFPRIPEQEYYSSSVKKKVVALANAELHGLARKLLEK